MPCHTLGTLQHVLVCTRAESLQSCPTLCGSVDRSCQAPLSMEFSRQEDWSGLPCPLQIHVLRDGQITESG